MLTVNLWKCRKLETQPSLALLSMLLRCRVCIMHSFASCHICRSKRTTVRVSCVLLCGIWRCSLSCQARQQVLLFPIEPSCQPQLDHSKDQSEVQKLTVGDCQVHFSNCFSSWFLGRITFTEPNIQNVPRDFEIKMPTLVRESPPSQAPGKGRFPLAM